MVYRDCRELHSPERYNGRETHFYPVLIAFNSKTPPFSDLTQTDKWPNGQTDLQTDGDGVHWTLFSLYFSVCACASHNGILRLRLIETEVLKQYDQMGAITMTVMSFCEINCNFQIHCPLSPCSSSSSFAPALPLRSTVTSMVMG